jgi:glucose-6-phosphate-specific signal transduction histidine kinase
MPFTIRGLDSDIEEEIRDIARKSHKSINQVIKEVIQKELRKRQYPASSLKQLAGQWSREEADAFEKSISSCEQIDEEMWK